MVLAPCWAVGSYGWNWQVAHNIHLLDPAPSDPIEDKSIHRCRRVKTEMVRDCGAILLGSIIQRLSYVA